MKKLLTLAAALTLFVAPAWAGTVLVSNGGAVATSNPLPITGTVTQTGPWAVTQSGSWNISLNTDNNTIGQVNNNTDTTASGTLTAAGGTVQIATNGAATVTVSADLSGTSPTATVQIQGEMPDGSWNIVNAYPIPAAASGAPAAQPVSLGAAGASEWVIPSAGFLGVRLNLTAIGGTSPSLAVTMEASAAPTAPATDAAVTGVSGIATPLAIVQCQNYAMSDTTGSTSGATVLVPAAAGKTVRICGYSLQVGSAATNVALSYAPATCGTGNANLTPEWQLAANGGRVEDSPFWNGLAVPAGDALCLTASAANPVQAEVWYAQY